MLKSIFGLVCLLISTLPAAADTWDDATNAFDQGHYDEVFNLLAPLAKPENVGIQLLLYDTYALGRDALTTDTAKFEWTRRGAKLGIAPAQESLAQDYLHGTNVTANEARAAYWFGLAADQWYAPAVYNLGVLTMNGQGVAADPDYAIGLFRRAAELNEPYALYVLGGMYLEGSYVAPDVDLGVYYLSQAAHFGQRRAMALLGVLMESRGRDPNHLIKSAFHFRRAVAAGCDDVEPLMQQAVQRLSPDEVEVLEDNLVSWAPDLAPYDLGLPPGHCLSE